MSEIDELDAAWVDYAERITAAGRVLTGDGFPTDPRLRAEGYRFVKRLDELARQIYIEFPSTTHPTLFRYGDDITPFGATNTDNNYYRAMIDPNGTYRVSGDVTGVREMLFSIQDGEFVYGRTDVLAEAGLDDLELDDGWLDLTLGGPEQAANWLPLAPDAVYLNVREFVADWERDALAVLHIERIDRADPVEPLTPRAMIEGLANAARWVETSLQVWHEYGTGAMSVLPENALPPPMKPVGGAVNMLHGACRWQLRPGEALLFEFDPPDVSYWSIQTYVLEWMQPLDFVNRVTSLNSGQLAVDDDGRTRIVLAHEDPGVPNWLDTTGLERGLVSYRYVRPATAPAPNSRSLALADVRDAVPASTPVTTPEMRAEQIAARRRGIARRFRR